MRQYFRELEKTTTYSSIQNFLKYMILSLSLTEGLNIQKFSYQSGHRKKKGFFFINFLKLFSTWSNLQACSTFCCLFRKDGKNGLSVNSSTCRDVSLALLLSLTGFIFRVFIMKYISCVVIIRYICIHYHCI